MLEKVTTALSSLDWQLMANITSSLAIILAIVVFALEIRSNRRERQYTTFFRYVDAYQRLEEERRSNWQKLKEVVRSGPSTRGEIGDKTNSIDYLLLRANQTEPMYAIEHTVLEYELQSLNLLNEMCRYSCKDSSLMSLVKALFAKDISFYQNHLQDLLKVRDRECQVRLFSVPQYQWLAKCRIADVFDVRQEQA